MLGLPVSIDHREEDEMIAYLERIQRATGINLNVNIGTFIPKVFTPFRKAKQLEEMTSLEKILYIKKNVGKNIRISFHSPFASLIEAVLSRGDKRAGELFLKAYERGARLDSWDDHLDRNLWKELIGEAEWDVEKITCSDHSDFTDLYDFIDLSVSEKSLDRENELSFQSVISDSCDDPCKEHCGVCSRELKVRKVTALEKEGVLDKPVVEEEYHPYLFIMEKDGPARFMGHLDFSRTIERTFYRCSLPLKMSQGFNPKPKMEFANPLSLGVSSEEEVVLAELTREIDIKELEKDFAENVPSGIKVRFIRKLPVIEGRKKLTLMKNWGGSDWIVDHVGMSGEKLYEALSEKIQELGIESTFKLSMEGNHVGVRQIFSKEKVPYNSLNKFLRENISDIGDFRITRVKSWAADTRGELISYPDFFRI